MTFARSSFHVEDEALVPKDMKQPHKTIRCVERFIRRSCAEIAKNNEDDLISFHYEDDERCNSTLRGNFRYKERKLSPELVSALIPDKIGSSLVDRYKPKKNPKVVISVPAYFT